MFKRFFVVLAILTGCRSKPAPPPTAAGTSEPLKFPVVLIGQGFLDVRDDMPNLTSATGASGMNFYERTIVDSSGAIFEVKKSTPLGKARAWWLDMGTSRESYYLELKKTRSPSLDRIKQLVIEQLDSPRASGNRDPKAVAHVNAFASVPDLIEGCRTSWEWAR